MRVKELVELATSGKNRLLKEEQFLEVIKKAIETKEYIDIKEKKELIEDIINECILYEDGLYKFDDVDKYICFTMKTIAVYTNLELSDDIEDDYDLLCESGLLDMAINTFKEEYDSVNILLQMKCDYILSGNSIEAQLGKFLDTLSDKIDVIAEALAAKVGDFNYESKRISRISNKW
jgi:hypothetical protein